MKMQSSWSDSPRCPDRTTMVTAMMCEVSGPAGAAWGCIDTSESGQPIVPRRCCLPLAEDASGANRVVRVTSYEQAMRGRGVGSGDAAVVGPEPGPDGQEPQTGVGSACHDAADVSAARQRGRGWRPAQVVQHSAGDVGQVQAVGPIQVSARRADFTGLGGFRAVGPLRNEAGRRRPAPAGGGERLAALLGRPASVAGGGFPGTVPGHRPPIARPAGCSLVEE